MDNDPSEGDASSAAEPRGGREREFLDELLSSIRDRVVAVVRRALAREGDVVVHALAALQEISTADLAGSLDAYRTDVLAGVRLAERAAALQNLASGLGHDLRNPLGVIESSVFLLRQHLEEQVQGDPKIERHLSRISAEIHRAEKLLGDLATLTNDRPLRRRETAIADLLRAAVSAANLPTAVEVAVSVPTELVAPVDVDQLTRAILGLLVNASQAMTGSGRIKLDAGRVGPEFHIAIRDTGPGVPADIRARVFEPLFTTKAKSSGLGLTLARRHAGHREGAQLGAPARARETRHAGTPTARRARVGHLLAIRRTLARNAAAARRARRHHQTDAPCATGSSGLVSGLRARRRRHGRGRDQAQGSARRADGRTVCRRRDNA